MRSERQPISRVAGKARFVAEVFLIGQAVRTAPASVPDEPRNANPGADSLGGNRIAERLDDTDNLMARHDWKLRIGNSPSTICRSVRQTAQASTRTRISPGPG
jgi:hypothetical protein